MTYAVSILRRAQKELGQLSSPSFERVCDYRVIYQIDDPARTVLVLHVGHRRDIYN